MNSKNNVKTMTIAGLLCAIGILIPMYFPKVVIGPASYTLASHVAIFIAMFISPTVTVSVSLVTTLGFFIAGFPIEIVCRAASHLIFAAIGAFLLKKNNQMLTSLKGSILFSILVSFIHALAEVLVITYFFLGNPEKYSNGYFYTVILLVGFGTFVHSMVDFYIATFVWQPLQRVIPIPTNAKIRIKHV